MKTLTAYTTSGQTWEHKISLRTSDYDGCLVLQINGPIAYKLTDDFMERLRENRGSPFTIDMGGRNYGVNESVYVHVDDVLEAIHALGGAA